MLTARTRPAALVLVASIAMLAAGHPAQADNTPESVVRSFNQAITERDLDGAMEHLLPKGVQFNLRPSHGGLEAGPLTSELHARWQMIGPVLFSATKSYTRRPEVVDMFADGDVATVWVEVETETVLASDGSQSSERFSEIYLLFRTPEGWRIAGVADNRQPDDIGLGAAQPAG